MKKIFLCLTIVIIIATLLCSCSKEENIESVKIDDTKYPTIYLYSFEGADVEEINEELSKYTEITATSEGYIYSTQKLSLGDTIRVWNGIRYSNPSSSYYPNYTIGAEATITEVIDTYRPTIEEKTDTFKIKYYEMVDDNRTTVSNKEEIKELDHKTIEVVKERVTIQYES